MSDFQSSSTTVYTATFTATADGATTIDVAAGGYTDAAGAANAAATQFTWTQDDTKPTMTITASQGSSGFTSNDAALSLTFTSSEATANFVVGDIQVSNCALSNFQSNGGSTTVYTATCTATADGATTIDVAAGGFSDAVGNTNSAATQFNWLQDDTAPTMVITASEGSSGFSSNDAALSLTFTSNEATSNLSLIHI